jgi:hypothetical protein
MPTPCSPVIDPPCSMQRSRIAPDDLLGLLGLPGDGVVEEHQRVQVAVAGVEDVGNRTLSRPTASESDAAPRAVRCAG